jgi:hypothetical protein
MASAPSASERMEEDREDTFPPEVMLRIFSCLSGKDLLTRAGAHHRLPPPISPAAAAAARYYLPPPTRNTPGLFLFLLLILCVSMKLSGGAAALTCKYWHGLTQDEHLWYVPQDPACLAQVAQVWPGPTINRVCACGGCRRSLCMRDVEGITLLSLLQPDQHKKEKDYTPTDLVLLRSRDAFLEAKPQEWYHTTPFWTSTAPARPLTRASCACVWCARSSWLWLWRAQNVRWRAVVSCPAIHLTVFCVVCASCVRRVCVVRVVCRVWPQLPLRACR